MCGSCISGLLGLSPDQETLVIYNTLPRVEDERSTDNYATFIYRKIVEIHRRSQPVSINPLLVDSLFDHTRLLGTALLTPKMQFLDLPSEIRDQIYYWALITEGNLAAGVRPSYTSTFRGGKVGPWQLPYHSGVDASILYTNRQIHAEATRVLYAENQFIFCGNNSLIEFLTRIGYRNASFVNHIDLRGAYYETYNAHLARGLKMAPSLRRVEIEASLSPCSETTSDRTTLDFLAAASTIIASHPSLDKVVSRYEGGLQRVRVLGSSQAYLKLAIISDSKRRRIQESDLDLQNELEQRLINVVNLYRDGRAIQTLLGNGQPPTITAAT